MQDMCIELDAARLKGKPIKIVDTHINTTPSTYAVLLDFDGHYVSSPYWNSGVPFYAEPSGITDTFGIINFVKDKYKNFNILITKDSLAWSKANYKVRCIITTSDFYGYVSGVAYTSTFKQGIDLFVFSDNCYYLTNRIGFATSHELGHSIGLSHQASYDANCNLITSYKACDWSTGTGPIMGNALGCASLWWIGPTPNGCKTLQNDSLILVNNLK